MTLIAILFLLCWLGMIYVLLELMGLYSLIIVLPLGLFVGYYIPVIAEIK